MAVMQDNRLWIDRAAIIDFTGTEKSLQEVVRHARTHGFSVVDPVYNVHVGKFVSFKLLKNEAKRATLIDGPCYLVFPETGVYQTFETREEIDAHYRVRTGLSRVTILIERDDTLQEVLFPSVSDVRLDSGYHQDFNEFETNIKYRVELNGINPDIQGKTHYLIDRVMNPDWKDPNNA